MLERSFESIKFISKVLTFQPRLSSLLVHGKALALVDGSRSVILVADGNLETQFPRPSQGKCIGFAESCEKRPKTKKFDETELNPKNQKMLSKML